MSYSGCAVDHHLLLIFGLVAIIAHQVIVILQRCSSVTNHIEFVPTTMAHQVIQLLWLDRNCQFAVDSKIIVVLERCRQFGEPVTNQIEVKPPQ